jgi:hypothetical protein
MEIILSKQCESLTGSLGRGFGYYIRGFYNKRENVTHYFAQRSKHQPIPRDGHWRFIVLCAELAQKHLQITDIRVTYREVWNALNEACICVSILGVDPPVFYNAQDIINLKTTFSI